MLKKIKVLVPAVNPHICYIPGDRKEKIAELKAKTKKSLYRILCLSAGRDLSQKEQIRALKARLKSRGYKTIGVWATEVIDALYAKIDTLTPSTPIPCVLEDDE